jgi:hypothetical protein
MLGWDRNGDTSPPTICVRWAWVREGAGTRRDYDTAAPDRRFGRPGTCRGRQQAQKNLQLVHPALLTQPVSRLGSTCSTPANGSVHPLGARASGEVAAGRRGRSDAQAISPIEPREGSSQARTAPGLTEDAAWQSSSADPQPGAFPLRRATPSGGSGVTPSASSSPRLLPRRRPRADPAS